MSQAERIQNELTPRSDTTELSNYRRALREYRHLVRGLGLDAREIESVLMGGGQGGYAHRRQILQSLQVEIDQRTLRNAGYSSAAIAESEEWLNSIRRERA
jgi:hypothetical protein